MMPPGRPVGRLVIFRRAADRLDVEDLGGFQNRNASVTALVRAAFQVHRARIPEGDWAFGVYTGDDVSHVADSVRHHGFPVFAFARSKFVPGVLSFPCFSFHAWIEAGIRSYSDSVHAILMASVTPPVSQRCFWIGNIDTHKLREFLYLTSLNHPDLADFRPMNWVGRAGEDGRLAASHYVSLPDHAAHALLLDIRGNGYSGRRKFLLHAGRPLLVVDGEFTEYWAERLVPWVHYVPVADHGHNLFETIEHLRQNPGLCEVIGRQGQLYALEHAQLSGALERIVELIDYAAATQKGRSHS